MSNNFTPKNYEIPSSEGLYMKFERGQNKFLILDNPVMGYKYWTTEKKPIRSTEKFTETPNAKKNEDGRIDVKHFWMFPVWNYRAEDIQILEITQKSIQKALMNYANNEDWGSPVLKYSISVNKNGEGLLSEYNTMANPINDISKDIKDKWEDRKEEIVAEIARMINTFSDKQVDDVEYPESIDPKDIPF